MPAIKFKSNILQNKVARRIVLLFLLSAIVPVILTAMLSMGTLANVLNEYNEEQLRREGKFYGMVVLNRLKSVENKLNSIVMLLPHGKHGIPAADKKYHAETEQIILHGGKYNLQQISGPGRDIPDFLRKQKEIIHNEKAKLVTHVTENGVRVFIQKSFRHALGDGYVTAEIKNTFLWGREDELPYSMVACISAQDKIYLNCVNNVGFPNIRQFLPVEDGRKYFEFTHGNESYIGANWDLFLKSSFISTPWHIAVIRNKDTINYPAELFSKYYPLVILLSLLIVLFLSLSLIRRNLVPMERLLEGTKRLANSEFSEKVVVDSDDEFRELAESFNMMSNKIECQVNALTILTEVDKIILSNPDSEYLYSRVVQFISRFMGGELCTIFTVGMSERGDQNEYVAFGDEYYCVNGIYTEKLAGELDSITFTEGYAELDAKSSGYGFLKNYILRGIEKVCVFPVSYKNVVPAVLVVGIRDGRVLNENEMGFLQEVSTRLAVAIATEERDRELYYHSHYDLLTHLPNRYFLNQRLQQQIQNAEHSNSQLAVLFIDLDRFKNINDSLGHSVGDKLLVRAAERLRACVRETDIVCRLGGDEFTVVLPHITNRKIISGVAEKIISDIARTFYIDEQELYVSASIGISVYPDDGHTCEELLKNADTAMYRAKENGRGHHQYFMEYMNREEIERTNMERELRNAIKTDQLFLVYQPLVDIRTGKVTGAETLLRWVHPERGIISAAEFVPLAEETGVIDQIGMWVINQACQQYLRWSNNGIALESIAVNVSSRQFASGDFHNSLVDILNNTGMSGKNLELEITENLLLDDRYELRKIIDDLHAMGVKFSIDDFGTGYSSLSYLKQFPVDTLKVDKGFLKDVPDSDDACAIVKTIVMMAHTLKMQVIAEGVENTRQLEFLKSIECNTGQGHYYHKPLNPDEFEQFYLNGPGKPRLLRTQFPSDGFQKTVN